VALGAELSEIDAPDPLILTLELEVKCVPVPSIVKVIVLPAAPLLGDNEMEGVLTVNSASPLAKTVPVLDFNLIPYVVAVASVRIAMLVVAVP
jgi:hypothetical protein